MIMSEGCKLSIRVCSSTDIKIRRFKAYVFSVSYSRLYWVYSKRRLIFCSHFRQHPRQTRRNGRFFSRTVPTFRTDAPMISCLCKGKFYVPASWNVHSSGWNIEFFRAKQRISLCDWKKRDGETEVYKGASGTNNHCTEKAVNPCKSWTCHLDEIFM